MERNIYDVVIVGAGISGLSAAHELLSEDPRLKLLVLEAKDRLGGRTLTASLKTPTGTEKWDLGGQWVSDSQEHIMDLLSQLQINTYPQFLDGIKFMQIEDHEIKTYRGIIPSLSFLSLLDLQWFLYKFEKLCQEMDVNNPYSHPKAAELDNMSVLKFNEQNLYTSATKSMLSVALRATFGFEATDLSALYVLTYAKAAGGLMKLFEATHNSAQEKRVKGGTQQICERLAELIGNECVKLSSVVTGIYQEPKIDDSCKIKVKTNTDNEEILAKYVILAIPPHLAADIEFEPTLSPDRKRLLASQHVGHLSKYIVTYARAFWRENGYSGEIVGCGGPKIVDGCDTGPIGVVYDATTSAGSPALVGFLGGQQGIQWCSKPYDVRKAAILEGLSTFFGKEALDPIEYAEKIWSDEAYNGGCPVTITKPGNMKYWANELRKPFGRVHWAGTEMATSWCGYMSGAVQAGKRAAVEVLIDMQPTGLSIDDLRAKLQDHKLQVNSSNFPSKEKRGSYWYTFAVAAFAIISFFYLIELVE